MRIIISNCAEKFYELNIHLLLKYSKSINRRDISLFQKSIIHDGILETSIINLGGKMLLFSTVLMVPTHSIWKNPENNSYLVCKRSGKKLLFVFYIPLHGSQPCLGEGTCITQWNNEPCCIGPFKMDGSQWRVLTKQGPLEAWDFKRNLYTKYRWMVENFKKFNEYTMNVWKFAIFLH